MKQHPAWSQTQHRPWAPPSRPWVLSQYWNRLLFLHWEISADALRPLIPVQLEIDEFDRSAWIGIVPFSMSEVGPRGCPKPSWISDFPEINVRTYVVHNGKPGVWFFSLDVPHRLPVWFARKFFHLPYFRAEMQVEDKGEETHYRSKVGGRVFEATYRGLEQLNCSATSFEYWATERYCMYAQSASGQLFRGEVQHPAWPLQRGSIEIRSNSMLEQFPIGNRHPSVLYSKELPVVAWWPQRCQPV